MIVKLFKELTGGVKAIPALVNANAASRDELIKVVSELAAELQDGLSLASLYLRGMAQLDDKVAIQGQLAQGQGQLLKYHSEFRICFGLRKLRDRFKRLFDSMAASIDVRTRSLIEQKLHELESDERLIVDEFGQVWPKLEGVLRNDGIEAFQKALERELESVAERKKQIGDLAREIIDTI